MSFENEYLDFDEAVNFLNTTHSTMYKWLQAGKIPGHKLGRQWRFLREELEIHVSGKGAKINVQKDYLIVAQVLQERAKNKEKKVEHTDSMISKLPEQILWDAFDNGSRLVHISPVKGKFEISYRTNVGLEKLCSIQEESFNEIDSTLIKLSTLNPDGSSRRIYLHRSDEDVLQVKYHKIETVGGPRLTLRLWQTEKDILPLEKITNEKQVLENFRSWAKKKHGLIIVSGIPGSGKTTTVFSLLNEYKNQGRVIFTIEENVDFVMDGINQIEMKSSGKLQFDETFEKVYGSDPDVICLGLGLNFGFEEKAFSAAYRAASTGHLVILQTDQPTCEKALEYLKKHSPLPVENVLIGISSQKLVADGGKIKAKYEFLAG